MRTPGSARGDGGISEAHALDSLAGGVFVGRQREMGELKAALEDALSGRGQMVMPAGEPGIGKPRTAQELATYAGLRQCQVLWGRCYEGEGAPPYWPWVQAQAHFRRGLAAKGVWAQHAAPIQAKDAEAAQLLFGLGRAQAATAERRQVQEAVHILSRAFDYYESAGDVARAVAVAEYPLPTLSHGRTGTAQFVPRALKLVPPESHQAGRLLSTYGAESGRVENDSDDAQAALARAQAIARREGDATLEVRTQAALACRGAACCAPTGFFHIHLSESLEKAQQPIELARTTGDQQTTWSAHLEAASILEVAGEAEGSQRHAAATLKLAEILRGRYQLALAFRVNATQLRVRGDWQGARQFSDRGLGVAPQDVTLLNDRVLLEYEVGDFVQGGAYLERLLETIPPAAARPGI